MIQKLQVKFLHHNVLQVEVSENNATSSSTAPSTKKTKKIPVEHIGCRWTGKLSERQKHLDEVCGFVQIKCTYSSCDKMIRRKDLISHQKDCEHRGVECKHCHKNFNAQGLNAHVSVCDSVTISCPHGCKKKFERQVKIDHESTCTHLRVPCPMASVGCRVRLARKEINEHMLAATIEHMELIGKSAAFETHFLEWVIPDIRLKLTAYPSNLYSKPISSGLYKFSLSCQFNVDLIGLYMLIKAVDGIFQILPEKISMEDSQITVIHPTDASKDIDKHFNDCPLTVGSNWGWDFTTKEKCSVEYV